MSDKLQLKIDMTLSTVAMLTGIASTLEGIEQILRIVLELVSIFSCFLIIMVNWKKATEQIKKFFK